MIGETGKNTGLLVYNQYLRRKRIALVAALIVTLAAALYSLGIGSIPISLPDIFAVLTGGGEKMQRTAIMNIRLPRAVTAILVGSALAAAGAVMQCVLRNPLASASSLGVSQGAAFGAALGIVVFGGGVVNSANATTAITINNPYIVTLCAFVFGMVSTVVVVLISQFKKNVGPAGLILAGTALSSLFSGASTILQYFADDTKLGAIVFWTFGNLGSTNWSELAILLAALLAAMLYFLFNRWNYNAMESGADTAKSLGVNTRAVMLVSMGICSLLAAVAVSFVGIISFVGLVAPHIMRKFVGNDYRYLIPGSAVVGALLLVLADLVSRTVMAPVILPIGALTSFLGAPMFLFLLFKGGKRMVEVKNITFSYGRSAGRTLEDVAFDIQNGECVAVLGNNGAGKSTLLKCIDRIHPTKDGVVVVDGKSVFAMTNRTMAQHIAYVPQNAAAVNLTVFDTVLLGRKPYIKWDATAEDRRIVSDIIHQMGLDSYVLRNVSELSGGEAQKVVMARALAQQPKFLLLDEPTSNLDPKNQHEVLQVVTDIAKRTGSA